ncbi:hypothetical protein INR49_027315 [Caranx melampygus]|nr:hypothetical protein INR49_027315 [Caranx melampygus]
MAASIRHIAKTLCGLSPLLHPLRQYQPCLRRLPGRTYPPPFLPSSHAFCTPASLEDDGAAQAAEALSRYKDAPWDYLESEEYIDKYGSSSVWAGYRRNHKGSIPPQKTRKTCIRGDKICGNPCPICRDPNIIIHHQNVKLLEQFVSPRTGLVYDPTRTGVCMKQQKKLIEAIDTARDHGFLPFQTPFVDFSGEDFSNTHDAGLQHLPLVVVKVSIDLVDGAVLHHPQLTLSLCDEPGIRPDPDPALGNISSTTGNSKGQTVQVITGEFGDLDGVGVALQTEATQTLPAVLVGQVEVPHQVLCGRLLHVELISILLVEEAHFLQVDRKLVLTTAVHSDSVTAMVSFSPDDGSSSFPL